MVKMWGEIANGVGLKPGDKRWVEIDDLHYTTELNVLYRALETSHGVELRIVKNREWSGDGCRF